MSSAITIQKLKLSRPRVPVVDLSPFEMFATTQKLGTQATRKFLMFVERAGGSFYTDLNTLRLLFDVWEEKGKP